MSRCTGLKRAAELRILSRILAAPPDGLEALQVEYARLFSAPGPDAVSVHQSCYTDVLRIEASSPDPTGCGLAFPGGEFRGYLSGESCSELRRWYAEAGFKPSAEQMPDHIAVELEFAAHLESSEAACLAAGLAEDARAFRELRRDFQERFLGRWLGEFARRMLAAAAEPLYRDAARRIAALA